MIVSIVIGILGIIFGIWGCRRLFEKIQDLRSKGAKFYAMTFISLFNCWLHVLLFRPVKWKADTLIWFALYPYLEDRALGRKPKSALENWKALKGALKSAFWSKRLISAFHTSGKVFPIIRCQF
jgi:hypothetical protein